MKPVLHFQIPASDRATIHNANNMKLILDVLKKRFAKDYEIIVTPWQLQADNMINITITPDCDIREILRQLQGRTSLGDYNYHMKYLPSDVYHVLDYDGDEKIHPLDAMDEYWYPVIAMVNYMCMSEENILNMLKEKDINPFSLLSIIESCNWDSKTRVINFNRNDISGTGPSGKITENDYILWMLGTINRSSHETSEVYDQIKAAGVNPMLVVKIENKDSGFPFTMLDETTRIETSNILDQHIQAALFRKLNNVNTTEVIPNDTL